MKWAVLIIGIFLAGCQTLAVTPSQQVYSLQLQLDAVLEEVEEYAALPQCDRNAGIVVACHDHETLDAMVAAASEADAALDHAETVVRGGGTNQEILIYVHLARSLLARIAFELSEGVET